MWGPSQSTSLAKGARGAGDDGGGDCGKGSLRRPEWEGLTRVMALNTSHRQGGGK